MNEEKEKEILHHILLAKKRQEQLRQKLHDLRQSYMTTITNKNKEHIDALKDYAAGFTRELVKSPMKENMLESIKTKLPVTAVATGEDTKALGDLSFDKNTMQKMFGTTNIKEIRDHLEIDESTNPPSLSYEASPGPDGSDHRVKIASIIIRPNGTGYSGGGMRFDMKMTTDFAKQLKDVNYGEDGVYTKKETKEQYESIASAYRRVKRADF